MHSYVPCVDECVYVLDKKQQKLVKTFVNLVNHKTFRVDYNQIHFGIHSKSNARQFPLHDQYGRYYCFVKKIHDNIDEIVHDYKRVGEIDGALANTYKHFDDYLSDIEKKHQIEFDAVRREYFLLQLEALFFETIDLY